MSKPLIRTAGFGAFLLVVASLAAVAIPAAPAGAATGVSVAIAAQPGTILPGQSVTVDVTATNGTDIDSTAGTFTVRRSKYVSSGATLNVIGSAGSCTTVAPRGSNYRTSTCPLPVIPPGTTAVVAKVKVTAATSVPYGGTNIPTTVSGPDNSVSITFQIRGVGPADLVPNLSMTPNPAMVGQVITATAGLNNWGYTAAPAFTSRITLPVGASGVAVTTPPATSCTAIGNVVDCTTDAMPAGGFAIVTLTFAAPPPGGALASSFAVDLDGGVVEASESNNTAAHTLTLNAHAANLVTTSTNPDGPVPAGSVFTRTLTVHNAGGAEAAGVILTDKFASPFGYVSASAPAGTSCSPWYLTLRFNRKQFNGAKCQLGTIPAGGTVSVDVRVSVLANATPATITDTVNATTTSFRDPAMNASSAGTTTVYKPAIALVPTNTVTPVASGIAVAGNTLTTSNGTWVGATPTYTYRWQRCDTAGLGCVDITGATSVTYVVQPTDAGSTLRSVVTATNAGGSTEAASAVSATVTAPTNPVNTVTPTLIPGLEKQPGFTWGVTNGTWTGTGPIAFTYQWQRCDLDGLACTDIAGATGPTYLLADADVFHTIRARVTAANSGGSTSAFTTVTGEIDPFG